MLKPIGRVESPLTDTALAPKQGHEGAPDAWLVFEHEVHEGLQDLRSGDRVIVLTWLDRARRDVLRVHPRDDPANPEQGVFSTRSADRPNPIGLHEVEIVSRDGGRVLVTSLEAVDGTPILDVKPVLGAHAAATRPRRIYNPVQRDAATFLETSEETGGERTLAELEVAPGGKVTPHSHLTYSERFTVLEGRLVVEIDGVRNELGPGDEAVAAPGRLHAWSNPGEQRTVAHVELRPGSPGFEKALRIAYGLAADGLVLKSGVPRNPLHAALLLEIGEMRLPGAYAALERVVGMLARLARRRGVDRKLERRYL